MIFIPAHYFAEATDVAGVIQLRRLFEEEAIQHLNEQMDAYNAEVRLGLFRGLDIDEDNSAQPFGQER